MRLDLGHWCGVVSIAFLGSFELAGFLGSEARAADIHVPADYPTIQQAIAAASDGDSILVDPGTYHESVDFLGKAISVAAVSPDPTLTVIAAAPDAPAVLFQLGETNAALLEGFTLTGGSGVLLGAELAGGNLFVSGASPTLRNLIVRDDLGVHSGGGAYFRQSSSHVDRVVFRHCSAENGGGLFAVDSTLELLHCRFEGCHAVTSGGGLRAESCPSLTISATAFIGNQASDAGGMSADQSLLAVTDCRFEHNFVDEGAGGGMYLYECAGFVRRCCFEHNAASFAPGGALFVGGNASLRVDDCEFRSNFAAPYGSHIGLENPGGSTGPTISGCRCTGSEACIYVSGAALLEHNDFEGVSNGSGEFGVVVFDPGAARFTDNRIHGFDAGVLLYSTDAVALQRCRVTDNYYSGIEAYEGSGVVEDCLFAGSWIGGYFENASVRIDGCTISRNLNPGDFPGGLFALGSPAPALRNSIVYGNGPKEIEDQTGGLLTVDYCDIGGGWTGTGNLDADPLFVDPPHADFSLRGTSPCIDVADPSIVTTRRDWFGRPRKLDGLLVRREAVDLGAFEFGHLTLSVTGNATPGGTIQIDTSGNVNLAVWLLAGLAGGEFDHPILGTFYVDFGGSWSLIPWGSPPNSIQVTLPPSLPVPLSIHLQEVGVHPGNGSGNTSNDVILLVQ